MALFRKKTTPEEFTALTAEIDAMKRRLDESDQEKAALADRLSAAEAARQQDAAAAAASAASAAAAPMGARLAEPPAGLSIDDVRAEVERLVGRMDELDARMTNVSTELANQLSELSGELDVLLDQPPPTTGIDADQLQAAVSDEVRQRLDAAVDDIEASTTRLAAEQARYQIQFRQDLAEVAERLKRAR